VLKFSALDTFYKKYAQTDIDKVFDRVRKTIRRESHNLYNILLSDPITIGLLENILEIAEDFEYVYNEYSSNPEMSKRLEEDGIIFQDLKYLVDGLKIFYQKYRNKYEKVEGETDSDQPIFIDDYYDIYSMRELLDFAVHDSGIPVLFPPYNAPGDIKPGEEGKDLPRLFPEVGDTLPIEVEEDEKWETDIDKIQKVIKRLIYPEARNVLKDFTSDSEMYNLLFAEGTDFQGKKGVKGGIINDFMMKDISHENSEIRNMQKEMKTLSFSIMDSQQKGIVKTDEIIRFMNMFSDLVDKTRNSEYKQKIEGFKNYVSNNEFLQVVDNINDVVDGMRDLNLVLGMASHNRKYDPFSKVGREENAAIVNEFSIENREILRELDILFKNKEDLFQQTFTTEQATQVKRRVYDFISKLNEDIKLGKNSSILNYSGDEFDVSNVYRLIELSHQPDSEENFKEIYNIMKELSLEENIFQYKNIPRVLLKGLLPLYEIDVETAPMKFDEAFYQLSEKAKEFGTLSGDFSGEQKIELAQDIHKLANIALDPVIKNLSKSTKTKAFEGVVDVQLALNEFSDLIKDVDKILAFHKHTKVKEFEEKSAELLSFNPRDKMDKYKARFNVVAQNIQTGELLQTIAVYYLKIPGFEKIEEEIEKSYDKIQMRRPRILEPIETNGDTYTFKNPYARFPIDFPIKGGMVFNPETFNRSLSKREAENLQFENSSEEMPQQIAFNFSKKIKKEAFNLSKIPKKADVNKKDNHTVVPGHICRSCIKFEALQCDWGNKPEQSVLTFVGDNGDKLSDCSKYIALDADLDVISAKKDNPILKKAQKMKDSDLNMELYRKIRALSEKERNHFFDFWKTIFSKEYAGEMCDDIISTKAKNNEDKDRGKLNQPKEKTKKEK